MGTSLRVYVEKSIYLYIEDNVINISFFYRCIHKHSAFPLCKMAEKLHEYQGFVGRLHTFRETVSTRWQEWKEKRKQQRNLPLGLLGRSHGVPPPAQNGEPQYDYSHIYRSGRNTHPMIFWFGSKMYHPWVWRQNGFRRYSRVVLTMDNEHVKGQ